MVIEDEHEEADVRISEGWEGSGDAIEDFSGAFVDCEIGEFDTGEFIIAEAKRQQFFSRLTNWRESGARIAIYFQTEGEIERFREIMTEAGISLGRNRLDRRHALPRLLFSGGQSRRAGGSRTFRSRADARPAPPAADCKVRSAARADRFQRAQRRRVGRPSRARHRPFSRIAEDRWSRRPAKSWRSNSPTRRNSTSRWSRLTWSRATSAWERNRRPSVRWPTAKWSRAKKNAAASIFDYAGKMLALQAERETQPVTPLAPTRNGSSNSSIPFPFAKRPIN